ncbi:MAG TPA: biotin carboxylase N-terminal domain-containing protein [Candidatus Limnocylindrales bacterium]|nr:biotin carboxylase N-terminal domain-containing protein [Candidatus Limnocylindrales bacterium]
MELSPSQAAERIGTSTRTVQRWIAAGNLPARRVGGRWRVASDALDAFDAAATASPGDKDATDAQAGIAIRRLFVANRGEIARRIERTCHALGIEAIVPRLDGRDAPDLLDPGSVIAAAIEAGADAIHPGYGFLAEYASFAQAVGGAGIRWIGPPPEAIRAMGNKAAARRLARELGIAVLDGYDGDDQADATLASAAAEIGYPVLVKPAGGGGGKGMRIVRTPDHLADSLAAARREASTAFGDDRLILERFLEGPRHIEVQVLFDRYGSGVQLGERDCSIQRRHQKILEETPSPAVREPLRRRLGAAALRLAEAVGYVSAGTCEFLVDGRGRFYFLEMNTRLQVEHPVTELVTGRDLVADQIRIAEGASLAEIGATQRAIDAARAGGAQTAGGHAVEIRLYAEDAEDGFLPATGRVVALRWPSGPGIRVDSGIDEGDEVGGRFDPMLAKIVAHGIDRSQALGRLTDALDDTLVLGLVTNLRFLRWLARQPAVTEGLARIDTLDRIWPPDDWLERTAVPDDMWAIAASSLGGHGWRLNGPSTIRLTADGVDRIVRLEGKPGELNQTGQTDRARPANDPAVEGDAVHLDIGGRSVRFRVADPPDVGAAARAAVAAHHGGGDTTVTAPMPGLILAVHVRPGAAVEAGAPIATLEAMKMEHVVISPRPGTILATTVAAGDQVARGDALVEIAAR